MVADSVSWAANVYLALAGPALVGCAAGRRAELARALGVLRVAGKTLVAAHNGEIVRCAVLSVEYTGPKFEKGLSRPLGCWALVGGSRETHTNATVRCHDRAVLARLDLEWVGDLVHAEACVNLEDTEGLVHRAVVVHGDQEGVRAGAGDGRGDRSSNWRWVAVLVSVVCTIERNGGCRKGEAHDERGGLRSHLVGLSLMIVDKEVLNGLGDS